MQQLDSVEVVVKFNLKKEEQVILYNWLNNMQPVMNACGEFNEYLENFLKDPNNGRLPIKEIKSKYAEIFLKAGINV